MKSKISQTATELTVIRLAIEVSIQAETANWVTLTKMIRKHIDKHADRQAALPERNHVEFGIMAQQGNIRKQQGKKQEQR